MLYPLSAQIPFAAQFTTGGAGASGLTVTVSIVRLNSDGTRTTVITAASATAATELDATNAKGLYGYLLAGASTGTAGIYLAIFHTAGTADLKDVPALEIVGAAWVQNVDVPLSTIAAYIDTEVAAIKAKTDNLPTDPADASDIATSFTTVNATLTTLAGYVDTEVAAIKAKTDLIPSDPADASDIVALFGTVNTALTTIDDFLDTEIAALIASLILVKAKTDLIGAASVTVTSAVSVDGTSINLYAGTDYHTTETREVLITDTSNSWPDLTGATAAFYVENEGSGVLFTKAMTIVVASGAGKQLKIEFTAANTVSLRGDGSTTPGSAVVSTYAVVATLANTHKVAIVPSGNITVTSIADGAA